MPKLQIYRRKDSVLVAECELQKKDGKYTAGMLIPNFPMKDVVILVDGQMMEAQPIIPPKREFVTTNQIKEAYWTYGENHTSLSDSRKDGDITCWKSKKEDDLSLHVVTNEGNDGKVVKFKLKTYDDRIINLRSVVSDNKVVFNKVFEK